MRNFFRSKGVYILLMSFVAIGIFAVLELWWLGKRGLLNLNVFHELVILVRDMVVILVSVFGALKVDQWRRETLGKDRYGVAKRISIKVIEIVNVYERFRDKKNHLFSDIPDDWVLEYDKDFQERIKEAGQRPSREQQVASFRHSLYHEKLRTAGKLLGELEVLLIEAKALHMNFDIEFLALKKISDELLSALYAIDIPVIRGEAYQNIEALEYKKGVLVGDENDEYGQEIVSVKGEFLDNVADYLV